MSLELLPDKVILALLVGKPRAKQLYRGSLAALLNSETEDPEGKLFAAEEFIRRVLCEEMRKGIPLGREFLARNYLQLMFKEREREVFVTLYLDSDRRLQKIEEVHGTLDRVEVYPREIVRTALKLNAESVIVAHNHLSGSAEPSVNDIRTTRMLRKCLGLVNVSLLDHFVVSGPELVSFAERGLMD